MVELEDFCLSTYGKSFKDLCPSRKRIAVICVKAINDDIKKRKKKKV